MLEVVEFLQAVLFLEQGRVQGPRGSDPGSVVSQPWVHPVILSR